MKSAIFAVIFSLLLNISSVFAGDDFVVPPINILGADQTISADGDLVTLTVDKIQLPDNVQVVKYAWKVLEGYKDKQKVYITPDGTTVLFGAGTQPRDILVVLDVTFLLNQKSVDGKTPDLVVVKNSGLISKVVKIGNSPDPGPNPPAPDPNPSPSTVPDGQLGFTKLAFSTALNVKSTHRATDASLLAKSYDNVISKIKDQTIKDLNGVFDQIRIENNAVLTKLTDSAPEWKSFLSEIQKSIYQGYVDKKLATIDDYVQIFKSISDGLNLVKQ